MPSDIKRALRLQNEQAVASQKDNSLGFLSKLEKREATEMSNRQMQEDLASGKYRKPKMVPIIWDLQHGDLYFGSTTLGHIEQLHKIMRDSFGVELDQMTAGALARQLSPARTDIEDLRPSAFTAPPEGVDDCREDGVGVQDISIPFVPWTAASVDIKDFLGNEFLIWLWWLCEAHEGMVELDVQGQARKDNIGILFDKTLQMDCAWGVGGKQTLKGDGPTRLAEADKALTTGKWPRKAGLIVADSDSGEQWELTFAADQMVLSGVKLPPIEEAQSPRELTELKITSTIRISEIFKSMFGQFVTQRLAPSWQTTRQQMVRWIKDRHR